MSVPIKPVLKGAAATSIALFVFWQISIWVTFMIGINSRIMLFLAVVSAQVIGGYAAANNLQAQSRLTYLMIGGLSGLTPIILVALFLVNSVSETGFALWVVPVVLVVGIVSSIAGAYIGSRKNIATMEKNA